MPLRHFFVGYNQCLLTYSKLKFVFLKNIYFLVNLLWYYGIKNLDSVNKGILWILIDTAMLANASLSFTKGSQNALVQTVQKYTIHQKVLLQYQVLDAYVTDFAPK
jgi:cellobiose-specific phosphotransferase system component IIC